MKTITSKFVRESWPDSRQWKMMQESFYDKAKADALADKLRSDGWFAIVNCRAGIYEVKAAIGV